MWKEECSPFPIYSPGGNELAFGRITNERATD